MADNRALSRWERDSPLDQGPDREGFDDGLLPRSVPGSGQSFARAVKAYDFRRPDKFSKEQWGTLQALHETFARLVAATFSSRLRTLVSVRLSGIDQGLYEEWQAQVPSQTACYILSMHPLAGNIVVEVNSDIVSEVIDRLLGGTGMLLDRSRQLGEVELGLLRYFAGAITQSLEEMWSAVAPIRSEVKDLGTDAALIQIAGPTDVVVTAFFEVNIGNHMGAMSICIPYTVIEPLASKLSARVWFSSGREGPQDDRERKRMEALIAAAPLELVVRLGGLDLPARSVTDVQPGDTIALESRPGRPLELLIGERTRFRCLPGVTGNHLAVQVTEVVEERQYDFDGSDEPLTAVRPLPRVRLGKDHADTTSAGSGEPDGTGLSSQEELSA
jgi:flagellar motor switch protein FliM